MSLLPHDRYQYDSLILSKQTWAYPRQHLQQLLWCVVSVSLNLPEVGERKLCLWYNLTRRNHKELSLDLLHNVESVYFFYSNPVLYYNIIVLWDHRRIRGPSLTETSLCGAYLYLYTQLIFSTRLTLLIFPAERHHLHYIPFPIVTYKPCVRR